MLLKEVPEDEREKLLKAEQFLNHDFDEKSTDI